ncbi:unnamed protein product [Paramecium sonneborni]|uniref:Uncharacterized protein n=1 Tax=Paramecium sonneborni TaxID=65129 RepID=A0A8S1NGP8_9CILI|nr:unnamed protein product [Paramecium sonneborni]
MLLSKPKAVSFKLYKQGILVLVEGNNEEYTIIDYSYDNENLHEINIQVISHKIKQIIIHDYFALLIGEKMKSVITIGIDSVYLNQQNYKFQNNLLVPQILNVLVFSDIAKNEIKDYVYVYTRSKLLKLNLQARQFEIICSCQSKEQAKESPYYYELEYYNSKCDGCQKKRRNMNR